jgi:hypothetical protein
MYKTIVLASLLALALFSSGCGSSTPSRNNINGNWTAILNNSDGSLAYQFSATLTQDGGSELNITNLIYTVDGSCPSLASTNGAGGSFIATGSSNGWVTGSFAMSWASPAIIGPAIDLQGTVSNNTISGQWTLRSSGATCNGSGSFTMHPTTTG